VKLEDFPPLQAALRELDSRVCSLVDVHAIYLFGSVVRGEADEESDVDVLIVLNEPFSRQLRHDITDIVFEINLLYKTNISSTVVDKENWVSGPISVLPIKQDVLREGVHML